MIDGVVCCFAHNSNRECRSRSEGRCRTTKPHRHARCFITQRSRLGVRPAVSVSSSCAGRSRAVVLMCGGTHAWIATALFHLVGDPDGRCGAMRACSVLKACPKRRAMRSVGGDLPRCNHCLGRRQGAMAAAKKRFLVQGRKDRVRGCQRPSSRYSGRSRRRLAIKKHVRDGAVEAPQRRCRKWGTPLQPKRRRRCSIPGADLSAHRKGNSSD